MVPLLHRSNHQADLFQQKLNAWERITSEKIQLVAQGVPILQGGEELGGPVSYLRPQIHLLMSIARVRPFDMVGHFPSF